MKKETIIAIVLGVTFGVVVSLFMVSRTKDRQLQNTKTLTKETKITPIVPLNSVQGQAITITQPMNGVIVSSKSVVIKGKAAKDSLIVIQSPVQDIIIKNDKEEFSATMSLAIGENVIHISVYPKDQQGKGQEKELRVYYLDEQ